MNAAFLLVTTACLVGQPAAQPAAPAAAAACGPHCGSSCHDPCGANGFAHNLRDRMQSLFQRNCSDNCQPTTCCNTHNFWQNRTPLFSRHNSCDDCGRARLWNWQPLVRANHGWAHASTCNDSCDRNWNILGRLRGIFQRDRDCCNSGTAAAAPAVSTPKVETPKKLPAEPKKAAPTKQEVRIETQPSAIPAVVTTIPAVPAVPVAPTGLEAQPAAPNAPPATRGEGDRRDPF